MKYLFFVIIAACNFAVASENADSISIVKKLYYSINSRILASEYKKRIFCNNNVDDKSVWVEVGADKDVVDECLLTKPIAYAFVKGSKVYKVKVNFSTKSGDWGLEKEFYYFDTGEVAFIFYKLVTLLGYDFDKDKTLTDIPYIVEKRIYFDKSGKIVKSIDTAFSKKTGESVQLKYLRLVDIDNYYNVSQLPFINKIRQ